VLTNPLRPHSKCSQEFYVKGIAYQPAPLGIKSMEDTGYGGGGLCSAKLTPYDEWKSACYDYDFFDGSGSSVDRVPPGPDSWFSALWERDLPVLKGMQPILCTFCSFFSLKLLQPLLFRLPPLILLTSPTFQ
jgi:hypothetical protein